MILATILVVAGAIVFVLGTWLRLRTSWPW